MEIFRNAAMPAIEILKQPINPSTIENIDSLHRHTLFQFSEIIALF
jgi:hypothetical protein